MRISLPFVRIGDNSVRFINYSLRTGNFTLENHIEVAVKAAGGSELFLATQTLDQPRYRRLGGVGFSSGSLAASDWLNDSCFYSRVYYAKV